MSRHLHRPGTLTIRANSTDSEKFTVPSVLGPMIRLVVYTPSGLLETAVMQVAPNDNPGAADWKTLQIIPGTDAILPAGRAVSVAAAGFKAVRIHSTTGEVVVDRVFELIAQLDVTSDGA